LNQVYAEREIELRLRRAKFSLEQMLLFPRAFTVNQVGDITDAIAEFSRSSLWSHMAESHHGRLRASDDSDELSEIRRSIEHIQSQLNTQARHISSLIRARHHATPEEEEPTAGATTPEEEEPTAAPEEESTVAPEEESTVAPEEESTAAPEEEPTESASRHSGGHLRHSRAHRLKPKPSAHRKAHPTPHSAHRKAHPTPHPRGQKKRGHPTAPPGHVGVDAAKVAQLANTLSVAASLVRKIIHMSL